MSLKVTPRSNKTIIEVTRAADRKQDSDVVHQGWAGELTHRVNEAPQELEDYFATYVPSLSDPPEDVKASIKPDVFNKWTPTKGREAVMYNHLVRVHKYFHSPSLDHRSDGCFR